MRRVAAAKFSPRGNHFPDVCQSQAEDRMFAVELASIQAGVAGRVAELKERADNKEQQEVS